MRKVGKAIQDGSVLPIPNDGDPVWVIGARNLFNSFSADLYAQVRLQAYQCLCCSKRWRTWGEMVEHLSEPKAKAAAPPALECIAYADEQRRRHREMTLLAQPLGRLGIRASSESCGHRGCENAAVLTGACSWCGAVNLFCPHHSYCCRCHHWYKPRSVYIDPDFCPCVFAKGHCRPGRICGVCDGALAGPTGTKTMSLRAMSGLNVLTAVQNVERCAATEFTTSKVVPARESWKPPFHRRVHLATLTTTVRAPSWYNNVDSGAIMMPAGVQKNASCGLHAVNHLLAFSSDPVVLHKEQFEECGLRAQVGDSPANLVDPRTGNYDFAVLHANLAASNLLVFPMTTADIESRLDEPFCQHVLLTGSHIVVGYLLCVPLHGGHWITLLPGRMVTSASSGNTLLCDSLYRQPFLLVKEETQQLLRACAIDAATGDCDSKHGFSCFLVAAAAPCIRWQMLFQLAYADGHYAIELARLCRKYGVTGTSSDSYLVRGRSGKEFTLLFYDQPQLAPDADKLDFPLSVWTTQDMLEEATAVTDFGGGDASTPTTIHGHSSRYTYEQSSSCDTEYRKLGEEDDTHNWTVV